MFHLRTFFRLRRVFSCTFFSSRATYSHHRNSTSIDRSIDGSEKVSSTCFSKSKNMNGKVLVKKEGTVCHGDNNNADPGGYPLQTSAVSSAFFSTTTTTVVSPGTLLYQLAQVFGPYYDSRHSSVLLPPPPHQQQDMSPQSMRTEMRAMNVASRPASNDAHDANQRRFSSLPLPHTGREGGGRRKRRLCWETDIYLVRSQHYVPPRSVPSLLLSPSEEEGCGHETTKKMIKAKQREPSSFLSTSPTVSSHSASTQCILSQLYQHFPCSTTHSDHGGKRMPRNMEEKKKAKKNGERGEDPTSFPSIGAPASSHSSPPLGPCFTDYTKVEEFSTSPSFDIYVRFPFSPSTASSLVDSFPPFGDKDEEENLGGEHYPVCFSAGYRSFSYSSQEAGRKSTTPHGKRRLCAFHYPSPLLEKDESVVTEEEKGTSRRHRHHPNPVGGRKKEWKEWRWYTWRRIGLFHCIPSLPLPPCNTSCAESGLTRLSILSTTQADEGRGGGEREKMKKSKALKVKAKKTWKEEKHQWTLSTPLLYMKPSGSTRRGDGGGGGTHLNGIGLEDGVHSSSSCSSSVINMKGTVISLGSLLRYYSLLSERTQDEKVLNIPRTEEEDKGEEKMKKTTYPVVTDPTTVDSKSSSALLGEMHSNHSNERHLPVSSSSSLGSCFLFSPPPRETASWKTVRRVQSIAERRHQCFHLSSPSEKDGEEEQKSRIKMEEIGNAERLKKKEKNHKVGETQEVGQDLVRMPNRKRLLTVSSKHPQHGLTAGRLVASKTPAVAPTALLAPPSHPVSLPRGCTFCPPSLKTFFDAIPLSMLYRMMKENASSMQHSFLHHHHHHENSTHCCLQQERCTPSLIASLRTPVNVIGRRKENHEEEEMVEKSRGVGVLLLLSPPLPSSSVSSSSRKEIVPRYALTDHRHGSSLTPSPRRAPHPPPCLSATKKVKKAEERQEARNGHPPSPPCCVPQTNALGTSIFFSICSFTPPSAGARSDLFRLPHHQSQQQRQQEQEQNHHHHCTDESSCSERENACVGPHPSSPFGTESINHFGYLPRNGERRERGEAKPFHHHDGSPPSVFQPPSSTSMPKRSSLSRTYYSFLHFPSEAPLVWSMPAGKKIPGEVEREKESREEGKEEALHYEKGGKGKGSVDHHHHPHNQDQQEKDDTEEEEIVCHEALVPCTSSGVPAAKETSFLPLTHTLFVYAAPDLKFLFQEGIWKPRFNPRPFSSADSPKVSKGKRDKRWTKKKESPPTRRHHDYHKECSFISGSPSRDGGGEKREEKECSLNPSILNPLPYSFPVSHSSPRQQWMNGTESEKDRYHSYWTEQLLKVYLEESEVTHKQHHAPQDITLVVSPLPSPSLLLRNRRWRREPYTLAEEMKYGLLEIFDAAFSDLSL